MKFAHIADTHIKNLKYHYEYREVFKKLYESLRKEKVDCIIHCGDIAHTKTQISPEFVELCTEFLSTLSDIAPTYIILGNHDGNLKNSSRQDAITPIAQALNKPYLYLLKNSGEVILNDRFAINVLSVFDRDNWSAPTDLGKVNIALYHGSISNSKTDLGWVMEHGEDEIGIFKDHDFGFLGDIHKTNQALDYKGRIRYAGSTIQQNHGETNDKGFLVWDIKDKDTFKCKHVLLENPKPFITIELTPKGRMPNKTKIPKGSRLRLVSNNNLSLDVMKKAVEIAKYRFKPESVTFLNRAAGTRGNVEEYTDGLAVDNLRDPVVQEELIREYLKDYQAEEGLLERVLKLNSKYNVVAEGLEEVGRNVNWKLESLEWENLFNYGSGNRISFSKLNGIVGIFGKNFSGKSSIIDSMLYTLFNSTSKNERKNLNIINQNKEKALGRVKISIGNKLYTVERNSEKYTKKLKGEETLEAKTDLNFECYDEATDDTTSLNGLTRNETDKIVRKHFGTLDDFLLTSMSSQLGSLQFIGEGSTRRKEILAKFLDLEMFEKKFKMAKEDATDLRGALRRLDGKEFDEDIFSAEKELILNEKQTREHHDGCEVLKKELSKIQENVDKIQKSIDSIPAEIIDIGETVKQISQKEEQCADVIANLISLKDKLVEKEELADKIVLFINDFDLETLQNNKEIATKKVTELHEITKELQALEKEEENKKKKVQLLKEVPCGDKFLNCKFICDAHAASKELVSLASNMTTLNNNLVQTSTEVEEMNVERLDEHLQKYNQLLTKKDNLKLDIRNLNLMIEKNDVMLISHEKELEKLEAQKQTYYENKDVIENKESFVKELKATRRTYSVKEKELKKCQDALMEFYKEHGSLEQKLFSLKEQKQELADLREQYAAYDLFMQCMHSNGISYDIIKKKLPVINNEIAKVLANVVNFEVFFENDGRHLRILIKHPTHDPRPIEMGSGAEKTIAAMAIRLALLSVSSLPKSNVFILDEPGTALDADNMDGFVRILELVKSYFKVVLLVSHLDSLKDCVDMQITIDKKDKFAHVLEA